MLALGSEFPNFQGVTQHGLVLELDDHLDLTDNEMVETVTRAKNGNDPKFSWMLLVTSDKALAPVFSTVSATVLPKHSIADTKIYFNS